MKSDLTAAEVRDAEQQVSFAAFAAWAIIGTNASPSDLQTMLRGAHRALVLAGEMLDCVAGDLEAVQMATPSVAAKSATPHRHKFNEPKDGSTPACTLCGKLKGAGGRKPAAAVAPPRKGSPLLAACLCTHPFSDHDGDNGGGGACAECTCECFEDGTAASPAAVKAASRQLRAPLGDAAADRYADGGQGSSGVRR